MCACVQTAYDDATSTFTVPSGGGFEVVFCPDGRSSNIMKTLGPELKELANGGQVSAQLLAAAQNLTLIRSRSEASVAGGMSRAAVAATAGLLVALMVVWA